MTKSPPSTSPPVKKRPFISLRLMPLVILLFILTLLSLILPGFFQQVVYAPIMSRLVVLFNIYRGIPQNLVWVALIILTLWVMLTALRPAPRSTSETFEEAPDSSRLSQLATLAADARQGQHARWELAREVQKIALQIIQAETGQTAVSLRQEIAQGKRLNAPPEINALLRLSVEMPNYRSFLDARDAASNGRIPQLDALDLDKAVATLVEWHNSTQERH